MLAGIGFRPITRRLGFRVMALLSVALLPLGLIAVMQTRALTNEIQTRSQLSLIALTRNAAAEERQLIQRAFGAARVLSEMIDLIADEPEIGRASCRERV